LIDARERRREAASLFFSKQRLRAVYQPDSDRIFCHPRAQGAAALATENPDTRPFRQLIRGFLNNHKKVT
jgi:hypothetical protein